MRKNCGIRGKTRLGIGNEPLSGRNAHNSGSFWDRPCSIAGAGIPSNVRGADGGFRRSIEGTSAGTRSVRPGYSGPRVISETEQWLRQSRQAPAAAPVVPCRATQDCCRPACSLGKNAVSHLGESLCRQTRDVDRGPKKDCRGAAGALGEGKAAEESRVNLKFRAKEKRARGSYSRSLFVARS